MSTKRAKFQDPVKSHEYSESDDDDVAMDNTMTNASIMPVKFEHLGTRDHQENESECWGCVFKFGKQRHRGKDPCLDNIYDVYEENKELVPIKVLARLISQAHFVHYVQNEIEVKKNKNAKHWSEEMILTHLLYHMKDMKREVHDTLKEISRVEDTIKQVLFARIGESGPLIPQQKNVTLYLQVIARKISMLNTLKDTMN